MSQTAGRQVDLPDRRLFWRWLWSAVRPFVGWILAAAGGASLLAGWYGVSGESLTAKQLPYLVSGGLTGVALFILAGVFLATDDIRRQFTRISELERKVDELHALFVKELGSPLDESSRDGAAPGASAAVGEYVALPGGSSYHRPDCALVKGKSQVAPVDAATAAARGLRPCRVCEPGPVAGAG